MRWIGAPPFAAHREGTDAVRVAAQLGGLEPPAIDLSPTMSPTPADPLDGLRSMLPCGLRDPYRQFHDCPESGTPEAVNESR